MSGSRNWCFTSHDLDFDPQCTGAIYGVYQRERCPTTSKEHLQGYLEFKTPVRLSKLKKCSNTVHWEPRKGTRDQARDYCMKEESRVSDPIEFGEWRVQGKRTDIHNFAADIRDRSLTMSQIAEERPEMVVKYSRGIQVLIGALQKPHSVDDVRGIWLYGAPGVGKSYSVYSKYPDAYRKAQNKWFDGYEGQSVIVLDDLDSETLGHYLKIWADRYPCKGEIKGGTVELQHDLFIVTSNFCPAELFPQVKFCEAIERRFKVIKVEKGTSPNLP